MTPEQWAGLTEIDPQTGYKLLKTRFIGKLPKTLSSIVNDAAYNLRSALDHAVYASVSVIHGGDPTGTKFPFGDTDADLNNDIKRGCRNVPATILDLIRTFKPYEAGNPVLWSLNKLRNRKGHKVLVPLGMVGNGGFGSFHVEHGSGETICKWDARNNEMIMMRVSPDFKAYGEITTSTSVTLYGVRGFEGIPTVTVLNRFESETERVVNAIEAETARLFRLRES